MSGGLSVKTYIPLALQLNLKQTLQMFVSVCVDLINFLFLLLSLNTPLLCIGMSFNRVFQRVGE